MFAVWVDFDHAHHAQDGQFESLGHMGGGSNQKIINMKVSSNGKNIIVIELGPPSLPKIIYSCTHPYVHRRHNIGFEWLEGLCGRVFASV